MASSAQHTSEGPIQIDLQDILRKRLSPGKWRFVPRRAVRVLERLIRQDELNGILRRTYPAVGTEFAKAVLADLNITVEVVGADNIPAVGRFVFASNHPLGGLDGIALIAVLGELYGDEHLRFPVNDLLLNVKPLDNIFVGINKYGRQGRRAAENLNSVWSAADKQVVIFPAGLVSRLGKGGKIADLEWHKNFVAKALEFDRDIIPVRVVARNSMRFYRLARWRKRLHIGVNLEQALLPSELCKARGSKIIIKFGKPLKIDDLRKKDRKPKELAAQIRDIVVGMAKSSAKTEGHAARQ